jgi:malonyl-CoA/methylmalonyl-CoA synthetase
LEASFRHVWAGDLEVLVQRYGARIAVTDVDEAVSYELLARRASALAADLARAGVNPGVRVATLVRNSSAAIHASWAIALTGACEVTLNPAQSSEEQAWCIAVSGARVLLHDTSFPALPPIDGLVMSCLSSAPATHGVPARAEKNDGGPEANWGRILFTSGTTGRPKGVVITHHARWLAAQLLRQSLAETVTMSGSTLLLTPFSHGASLLAYALLPGGRPVHIIPGFDADTVRRLVGDGSVGAIFAPPAVLVRLAEVFRGQRIRTVHTLLTGTAPLPATLYEQVRDIFGPIVRITYGMTEIFNPITVLEATATEDCFRALGEEAVGIVGWPAPGVKLSIRDESGAEVPAGSEGEVHVHAKHMYAGYLRSPGCFEPAGEFHATGDIGCVSSVHGLRLLGRMHDVIKTGGYKVNPQEVEAALREKGVAGDFTVLGLPSKRWGEIVLFARSQSHDAPFDDALSATAALTQYKRPRLFVAVSVLPRNAIGKIDRRALREEILAQWTLEDGAHPRLHKRSS